MADMNNIVGVEANVEIDGFPFYAEEINGTEPYNRRELKRTKIKNGTEHVTRGEYIPREYSFTTTVDVPLERPDIHDNVFRELMSKPCEVVCPDMGGIFNAEVIISKTHNPASPTTLSLDITVKEIPEESLIPNDLLEKPENEIVE